MKTTRVRCATCPAVFDLEPNRALKLKNIFEAGHGRRRVLCDVCARQWPPAAASSSSRYDRGAP